MSIVIADYPAKLVHPLTAITAILPVTPNDCNDRAPAREARLVPSGATVGRSGRLRGSASLPPRANLDRRAVRNCWPYLLDL